jgi:hypothetical protein
MIAGLLIVLIAGTGTGLFIPDRSLPGVAGESSGQSGK